MHPIARNPRTAPAPARSSRSSAGVGRVAALAACLTACLTVLAFAVACGGGTPAPAADGDAATAGDGARSYQVRGQITTLPDDADPLSNLVIRHEAIDDFESLQGEVVGMNSMSMPFPVADDVSLDGLAVGDKVRFTLEVDWDGDPAYQVTRIEPLPAGTELEYRKAQPPEAGG